jgi:hypothetical protein
LDHNSREAAGFVDAAEFEKVEASGEASIKSWIDQQLKGTSVTCVLVGAKTCASRWVRYEIQASIAKGNGLLGIDISKIPLFGDAATELCGRIPEGYPFYLWTNDDGAHHLGEWIEAAVVS